MVNKRIYIGQEIDNIQNFSEKPDRGFFKNHSLIKRFLVLEQ